MAANPYVNKVVYGGTTLIDLTDTTVTAAHLESGYTALDASGALVTGTLELSSTHEYEGVTVTLPAGATFVKLDVLGSTVDGEPVRGPNLLNEATSVDGYYISATGAPTSDASGSCYTDLIPVVPGGTYTISGMSGRANNKRLHAYDSNGSWLRQIMYFTSSTAPADSAFSNTFTVGSDVSFIRFSCASQDTDLQVTRTSTVQPYLGYGCIGVVVSSAQGAQKGIVEVDLDGEVLESYAEGADVLTIAANGSCAVEKNGQEPSSASLPPVTWPAIGDGDTFTVLANHGTTLVLTCTTEAVAADLVTKSITANGTYSAEDDDADGYSEVTVSVPNTYAASDEGKVVSSGALVSQTSTTKTANGTYDTTLNDEVVVALPLGSKSVSSNGTYNASSDSLEGYSSVTVAVDPNVGSKSISANGTYSSSSDSLDGYSQVSVDVPNSYSASDEGKVVSSGALVSQTSVTKTANGTYDTTLNNEVVVNVLGPRGGSYNVYNGKAPDDSIGSDGDVFLAYDSIKTREVESSSTYEFDDVVPVEWIRIPVRNYNGTIDQPYSALLSTRYKDVGVLEVEFSSSPAYNTIQILFCNGSANTSSNRGRFRVSLHWDMYDSVTGSLIPRASVKLNDLTWYANPSSLAVNGEDMEFHRLKVDLAQGIIYLDGHEYPHTAGSAAAYSSAYSSAFDYSDSTHTDDYIYFLEENGPNPFEGRIKRVRVFDNDQYGNTTAELYGDDPARSLLLDLAPYKARWALDDYRYGRYYAMLFNTLPSKMRPVLSMEYYSGYTGPAKLKDLTDAYVKANGTWVEVDISSGASASGAIPFESADYGKVVTAQGLVAQGSMNVTANGTYDTTTDAEVVVSVQPNVGAKTITYNGTYTAAYDSLDGYSEVVVDVPTEGGGGLTDEDLYTMRLMGAVPSGATGVSHVGNHGLAYSPYITEVTMSSCESIEAQGFIRCENLKEAVFPQCYQVGTEAFAYCNMLSSISLPVCTNLSGYAFRSCSNLRSVELPECKTIGYYAFYDCVNLETVSAPNAKTICTSAFINCSNLHSADFPECLYLNDDAFENCTALSAASFPKLDTIESSAFQSCSELKSLSFPVCTRIKDYAFASCVQLESAVFPECLSIGSRTFYSCISLSTAVFPKCTSISSHAFAFCRNLTTLSFPECLTVGSNAFNSCPSLESAIFPKCSYVSASAFIYCSSLQEAYFPQCSSIEMQAFESCAVLESAYFPKCSVVGMSAFRYCYNLKALSLPNCVSIQGQAFAYCSKLLSLYLLGSTYVSLINNTFANSPFSSGGSGTIYVPESMYSSYLTRTYWSTIKSRIAPFESE